MTTESKRLERLTELARLENYAHKIWDVFGRFYKAEAQLIFNAGGPDKLGAEYYSKMEQRKQQVIEQTISIIEQANKEAK